MTRAALTDAPEGVGTFERSPDGKSIAYLTRDPAPAERPIVTHVDAPDRPRRLFVRTFGEAPRTLTPTTQYVDSLSWSPDSTQIAYSAASHSGFTAQYVAVPRRFRVFRPGWTRNGQIGRVADSLSR